MPRLPVLIRQSKVFELVVAGAGYGEICRALDVSEDTVARDMLEIGEQVQALAKERLGEVLAVALATYQRVIDHAWQEYYGDRDRETRWYAGSLDYERTKTTVATKTLAAAAAGEPEPGDDVDDAGEAFRDESAPLEVKRTTIRQTVRPALRGEGRSTWLKVIVDATRELTELLGVKKLVVEHSGPEGGALPHVHYTLEQWRAESAARVAQAEQTFTLLGDDAEGDDA